MARRSTPQRDIYDQAFPHRLKVRVPPHGLGNELTRIDAWLKEHVTPGDSATHFCQVVGDTVLCETY